MSTGTKLRGAIFDVDGVLVATPHEHAWREALAGYADPKQFTADFYRSYVAGQPRLDGARMTLKRLDVPNASERATEYAQKKQAVLDRFIEQGRFEAFPDAVRFAAALCAAGLKLALASSSNNADAMLMRLTLPNGRSLLSIFSADLSGCEVTKGKPDPELFLLAAGALGFAPSQCVVIEDVPAGIRAANDGGMASVGIARRGDADLLREAGADLVVNSLDAVDVAALKRGDLRTHPAVESVGHA
jgi:beta-phosphoglucomutase-like phosphatase (HAD superfamily)